MNKKLKDKDSKVTKDNKDSIIKPIKDSNDKLHKTISPVSHVEDRIHIISRLILSGVNRTKDLLHEVALNYSDWKVSERQVCEYIKRSRELINEDVKTFDISYEKALSYNRKNYILKQVLKEKKYQTALQVCDSIDKITGVNAPIKTENDNVNTLQITNVIAHRTVDEVRKAINEQNEITD